MAVFTIPVAELDASGKHYKTVIPASFLLTAFEDSDAKPTQADGDLDVRLSKSGTDVVVHGHVRANVELPCARCLAPVKVLLAPEISVLMVPAAKLKHPKKDEDELTAADADVIPYDGETVVLDDLVRDELVLDIPMIPLCSETCPGISTQPEGGKTIDKVDPRLAPLLALKKMSEKKE